MVYVSLFSRRKKRFSFPLVLVFFFLSPLFFVPPGNTLRFIFFLENFNFFFINSFFVIFTPFNFFYFENVYLVSFNTILMILYPVVFLGVITFLFRGISILGFFLSLEILFFVFIFLFSLERRFQGYLIRIILTVGISVIVLTVLVSRVRFFGRDHQVSFLD